MTSKVTAANGIVAAASAAIKGVVNDCTKSNKKEPTPNPIPPIQNPLIQFTVLKTLLPSKAIQIKNSKTNANTFLTVITVTTSQSSTIDGLKALNNFFKNNYHKYQYLKIIHGKGLRNNKEVSPMRNLVRKFLLNNSIVLAFTPAQNNDGGDGATYVLIKK